jgi:tRNA(Arg) A34 adenosine deaminase TadA
MLESWMRSALSAAIPGIAKGEHPFGASVVDAGGFAISREHNRVDSTHNPAAHAEVLAIASAGRVAGSSDLSGCWLVSTAEPCPMCLAAAAMAGIRQVAFGARARTIENAGYETLGLSATLLADHLNCGLQVRGPILELECSALLLNHPMKE